MEEFEVGFDPIQPGKYLFQLDEGINLNTSEETGSQSYQFPMTVIEARDDDLKDNVGRKLSWFQNITKKDATTNPMGERLILNLLKLVGVADVIAGKFKDDPELVDSKVLMEIQRLCPSRCVFATVHTGKDQNGNPRPEIKNFKKYKKQKPIKDTGKPPVQQAVSSPAEEDEEDDWG
jgi:hypothetical protein